MKSVYSAVVASELIAELMKNPKLRSIVFFHRNRHRTAVVRRFKPDSRSTRSEFIVTTGVRNYEQDRIATQRRKAGLPVVGYIHRKEWK